GMPFLLLLPVLLQGYTAEGGLAALGTAFVCLGGLASIYTEFLVFELLLVVAFLVVALVSRPRGMGHCLGYGVLLAAPWLCNPLYRDINHFLHPATLAAGVLGHLYPWPSTKVGVAVGWAGDAWAWR